jgi:hypothetical protein
MGDMDGLAHPVAGSVRRLTEPSLHTREGSSTYLGFCTRVGTERGGGWLLERFVRPKGVEAALLGEPRS